jgi:hypothetical protein
MYVLRLFLYARISLVGIPIRNADRYIWKKGLTNPQKAVMVGTWMGERQLSFKAEARANWFPPTKE